MIVLPNGTDIRRKIMFDIKKFEAMLLSKNTTKEDVAHYLGISRASIYRRLRDGSFTVKEIQQLINFYGRDTVLDCLFSYDE